MNGIVLVEPWQQLTPSASLNDIRHITECATLTGWQIYSIPQNFEQCETAENALAYLPDFSSPIPAIWIGYIPSYERYEKIYHAAKKKNLKLPNSPEEHKRSMELDLSLPLLAELTPKSIVLENNEILISPLEFPVFVKGVVKSRKEQGIKCCVASNTNELSQLVKAIIDLPNSSRGKVIVREFVHLRHERTTSGNFPVGREYRVFIYNGEILSLGYYWEGEDTLKDLTASEEKNIRELAIEAQKRVGVPYLAVDIGQTKNLDWIIIEIGDAQFAGLSQNNGLKLWNTLTEKIAC